MFQLVSHPGHSRIPWERAPGEASAPRCAGPARRHGRGCADTWRPARALHSPGPERGVPGPAGGWGLGWPRDGPRDGPRPLPPSPSPSAGLVCAPVFLRRGIELLFSKGLIFFFSTREFHWERETYQIATSFFPFRQKLIFLKWPAFPSLSRFLL